MRRIEWSEADYVALSVESEDDETILVLRTEDTELRITGPLDVFFEQVAEAQFVIHREER